MTLKGLKLMSEKHQGEESGLDGMYICMGIIGALYFFELVDEKGFLVALLASAFFGPILGFFVYFIGSLIWMLFSEAVVSGKDYAKSKGLPAPLAWIWGLGCGLAILFVFG